MVGESLGMVNGRDILAAQHLHSLRAPRETMAMCNQVGAV